MEQFKKGKVTLIQADCMDIMETYDDNYFDLAVVDPEYGIGISKSARLVTDKGLKAKEWDNKPIDKNYFTELFRISKNQIIWGGNYFNLGITKHCIVWDKKQPEKLSFGMFEFAWSSFDRSNKLFSYHVHNENNKIHPTQKPVKLYAWILHNYAKPDFKILDTHGGSMSHAIAAYYFLDDAGELVIIEKDKDYFADAVKRFKNMTMQTKVNFDE